STYEWINLLFWGIHATATATAGSRRSQAHVHPPGRSRELDVADRRCDRVEPGAAEIGPFRGPDHARAHRHRIRARVDGALRCFPRRQEGRPGAGDHRCDPELRPHLTVREELHGLLSGEPRLSTS